MSGWWLVMVSVWGAIFGYSAGRLHALIRYNRGKTP